MVISSFFFSKKYIILLNQKIKSYFYGKYKDEREKNFFKNILGPEKNWSFLDNNIASYHYCDMSKLVVSSVSTLSCRQFQDLQRLLFQYFQSR